MSFYVKGDCRPGGWFGCTAPFEPGQLAELVTTTFLEATQAQGVENLILPGSLDIVLPPDGFRTIAAVLSHPDNQKYGLLHWTTFSTICMRLSILEAVAKSAVFKPGDGYGEFIDAIRKLGLEVVDVDLT